MLRVLGKLVIASLLAASLAAAPALAAPVVTACGGDKTAKPADNPPATLAQAVIPVKGMSCGSCAGKIRTVLAAIDGVVEASVDVAAGEARVSYDAAKVTTAALVKAITDAGYSAGEPTPKT